MVREATITQAQVNAAADTIRATGAKPTARAVREALGGVGSMATVLKFLQVWQAGQVRAEDGPVVLPAGLQRALVDFIGQEVASAKAVLQDDLVATQQANGDLIAESERQASHLEALENAIDELQDEASTVKGQLAQLEKDLEVAREEGARERQEAEHARTDLAKALLQLEGIPRLESELDRKNNELSELRQQLQQAQTLIAKANQEAAVSSAKLEACQAQAKDLDGRRAAAEEMVKSLGLQVASLRDDLQACQTRLASTERESVDLRKTAEDLRQEAKRSGEEAAELRGKLAVHNKATGSPAAPKKTAAKAVKPAAKGEA